MDAALSAAVAAAAAASPMSTGSVPLDASRTLLVDGDGLAYYCAGNDDTSPSAARDTVRFKLAAAQAASGAGNVRILVTGRGSNKGHRYAVATVKPYQGQRVSSRRPKNWQFLRELLELGVFGDTEITYTAEADDLFSKYSHELGWQNVVIYTQDKDMRMVPGTHLNWVTHVSTTLPRGKYAHVFDEKLYGEKWFFSQLLHGDTADNIPGLPKYRNENGNLALCGEKTAAKLLANTTADNALDTVLKLYAGLYGEDAPAAILEQGILLWMRQDPEDPFDVVNNGPLKHCPDGAIAAVQKRINEVPLDAA